MPGAVEIQPWNHVGRRKSLTVPSGCILHLTPLYWVPPRNQRIFKCCSLASGNLDFYSHLAGGLTFSLKEEKEKRKSRQSGDLVCRRRTEVSRDQPAVCSSLVPPGRGVSPREAPEPPCPAVRHTSSAAARQGYRVSVFVLGRVRLFAAPWTAARQAPPSMGFSRQEHCAGCHFLFQGILPTQGSNPGLPSDSLPSEPPGKP